MSSHVEEFVTRSLQLLSLERATELAESEVSHQHSIDSKSNPASLHALSVASQKVGLYGRHVVSFQASWPRTRGRRYEAVLPANTISNGDIVGLFSGNKPIAGQSISGVVTRSTSALVSVVFDDLPDSIDLSAHNGMIQLLKLANDVTYKRIKRALETLQSYSNGRCLHLISVLFSQSSLLPPHPKYTSLLERDHDSFPWRTDGLNISQCRAVLCALSRPDVAIIHGPPGTGKTTTVVELILQAVDQGRKVLACAPSNIAVDNLVEKLAKAKAKVVRIGHPARLEPSVVQYSLDALVANSDSAGIILDVRKDIDKAYAQCMKTRISSEKRKWRSEVKTLKGELKQREERCLKEILSSADVVLSTVTGASPDGALRFIAEDNFDMVVIDECAQALEASCWIPLLRAPQCVLAGDHCQLPPTILSQEAADKGFSLTLMERLVKEIGSEIVSVLTTQYRMHTAIMTWPSHALYEDTLIADDTVAKHLLSDLPNVIEGRETTVPLVFIDTAGCGLHELETRDRESKGNEGEADLVVHHIKKLRECEVLDKDIAVIAPYSLQVELIRQRLHATSQSSAGVLEVHTVDGFQGREKEAVIISLTRSNEKGEYGFLSEQRRSNVAVTRARRHLCLVGDSETVTHEPFMKGMIEHCHQHGEVWSAHEYIQDSQYEEAHYYQPKVKKHNENEVKHSEFRNNEGRRKLSSAAANPVPSSSLHTVASAITETSSEECIAKFSKTIMQFVESNDSKGFSFPSSLTGNERKIIHELCERFGLVHESKGQGKQRFIQIRKIVREDKVDEPTASGSSVDQKDSKMWSCDSCGRHIPLLNWELHHMQCMKIQDELTPEMAHKEYHRPDSNEKSQQKEAPTKRTVSSRAKHDSVEDLDALLAEVKLADSTCKFSKCSKPVSLLGVQCQFCKSRYCMEHSLAEIHGCGDAAKVKSRKDVQREEARSGSRFYGLSGVKRTQVQFKLTKNLEKKATARQTKVADSKSKRQK